MNSLMILVVAAALGIEVGWEPLEDGGHEYTIQFEPQMLEILRRGNDEIFSEVPPEVDVRRFRFVVGEGKLARVIGHPRDAKAAPHQQANLPDDDVRKPSIGIDDAAAASRSPANHNAVGEAEPPGRLGESAAVPGGLKRANHDEPPETVRAEKLTTPPEPAAAEPVRPWTAFVATMVLLCCSLGANIYLAWAAWDARSRYRTTVAKLRAAPAS